MKIYIETYGCTANKADETLIIGILKKNSYEIVKNENNADYVIILTCTVIDTTQQRMLSRIKHFDKLSKKIIIAGCMASVQGEIVKKINPKIKLLPPYFSHHIIDLLEEKKVDFSEKNKTEFTKYYQDIFAPIAISEGCLFSCSYCITSKARGKLKSFPINEIKKDIESALNQGCREIQITAQDTASYGFDKKENLANLLTEISKIDSEFKIRVGMMNPFTLLKNIDLIIKAFEKEKIYKFLHIPVQSGNNKILKDMKRKYSVEDFYLIINKFKEKFPDITIATDVIVGFPGETDLQFKDTIDLLKKVKPDITNITRFSARPFTQAKTMKRRLKTEIVKERSKILKSPS